MDQTKTGARAGVSALGQFGVIALCLAAILGFLFWDGIKPGHVVFSNDGPLGVISTVCSRMPEGFTGNWQNQNWIGLAGPNATPDFSAALVTAVGPLIFAKIYPAFALLFLGLSAWLCFRQWKFSPMACLAGGLAAALNSDFLSTACWGVAAQPISFGCDFLALAALADETSPKRWIRVVLAGFAVGLGVMEGFDIGAIFSLVVAAFVVYQGLVSPGTAGERVKRAVSRLVVVGACAGFIAAAAVATLINTQIKGVAGMGQDTQSKAGRWDEATIWSMPKRETLTMIIPGLFGFRMDTPNGGNYWGLVGRHPAWDRYFAGEPLRPGQTLSFSLPGNAGGFAEDIDENGKIMLPGDISLVAAGKTLADVGREVTKLLPMLGGREVTVTLQRPEGTLHYSGGGIYVGVTVVLVALWGAIQGFRKENSVFSLSERKLIWFWVGLLILCALVGLGRFAPFYKFFYALPFASTMRNPSKFYHVVEWIFVILFAYGANGLGRLCAEKNGARVNLPTHLRTWWVRAALYDKKWIAGLGIALGVSLLGWLIFASSFDKLVTHLKMLSALEGRGPQEAVSLAKATASFSIRQVGFYILFLALGSALLATYISGFFAGWRAKLGGVLLALLVTADLGIAARPWVVTWNWQDKYASNAVIDLLRQKPYEQRVALFPYPLPPELSIISQLYNYEWLQQLFPYYNIQTLNVIMMPRPPLDYIGFESAMSTDGTTNTIYKTTRRWELTNTRYIIGPAAYLEPLNSQIDPEKRRFKYLVRFDLSYKPGVTQMSSMEDVTAQITPQGQFAVFDFTGALPRAQLYANWRVNTNDQSTLKELASRGFDPRKEVLVANPLSAPSAANLANTNAGSVEIISYEPKKIILKANAAVPCVLLLNDKTNPFWHVSVDGKPETLLRCNYLMRGVFLQPGPHEIEFRFQPPIGTLYVSLLAVLIGIALVCYLAVTREKPLSAPEPEAASAAKPSRKGKR